MNEELKQSIKEKINELTMAEYEGIVQGLIIIVLDKGSFKIMPAYSSDQVALINLGLDLAKNDLVKMLKDSVTKELKWPSIPTIFLTQLQ